jgi:hypothetical protein
MASKKKLPANPITKAPLKQATKKKRALSIPKTPVKNIANKIASTGIPKEILEMHLENIANGTDGREKPKYEIGIRMLFCLADGWSLQESALLCGTSSLTIMNRWCNPKSEYYDEQFSQILSLGIHLSELWWTATGRANLNNKKTFDSTLWMMNMSNRFGWTRKIDGQIIEKWDCLVKEEKKTFVHHISEESIIKAGKILEKIGISKAMQNAIEVDNEVQD